MMGLVGLVGWKFEFGFLFRVLHLSDLRMSGSCQTDFSVYTYTVSGLGLAQPSLN